MHWLGTIEKPIMLKRFWIVRLVMRHAGKPVTSTVKAPSSAIKLTGESSGGPAPSSVTFRPDWNFESMGIGGLAALGRRMPLLGRLATRLDRSFEASGEISDRASDELRDARERARGLHRRIRARLDDLLRDEKFATNLREGYYSVRNDRYVVPVLSSHQREVEGIVHNASQSGQTLFVEPQELIGVGNELAIANSVVLEEERKVLMELSQLVSREAAKIEDGLLAASELDELESAITKWKTIASEATLAEEAALDAFVDGLWTSLHARLDSWAVYEKAELLSLSSTRRGKVDYPRYIAAAQRAAAGTRLLPDRQADVLAALNDSVSMRRLLGDQPVDVTLGVRRYEQETYGSLTPEALTDRFRMAWSL